MRPKVYVGLTTLPDRIDLVRETIDSLLSQSYKPTEIFISIPIVARRTLKPYIIPDWFCNYINKVKILWIPTDHGPGTKLLGMLNQIPPKAICVIVDDDHSYDSELIKRIVDMHERHTNAAFSGHVYDFANVKIGQGAASFSFKIEDIKDIKDFALKCLENKHAFIVDDLWISVFLWKNNVKVKQLFDEGPQQSYSKKVHNISQLHELEGNDERWESMVSAIKFLKSSGLMGLSYKFRQRARQLVAKVYQK